VQGGALLLELQPARRLPPCFDARVLAWSPDTSRLYVPSSDGYVRAWDTDGGSEALS
jgi:WD40 repeat protein